MYLVRGGVLVEFGRCRRICGGSGGLAVAKWPVYIARTHAVWGAEASRYVYEKGLCGPGGHLRGPGLILLGSDQGVLHWSTWRIAGVEGRAPYLFLV